MKKFYLFTFIAASILSACNCNNNCNNDAVVNAVQDNRANAKLDNYLYAIEYDDYDFDAAHAAMSKMFKPANAACTEVRRGNFVGRNLDWYINDQAAAIIKINHSDKHLASIGMVGANPLFTDSLAAAGDTCSRVYATMPLSTCDGINECGVYIGVNVMPTGETSFDKSTWDYGKWGHGAANTNPGAEKSYIVSVLTRVVLDNAHSVAEAKQIIESINWYEPVNFPHKGESQSFHWLLCDSTTSCVLEFIDNKPYYTETTEVNKPSYATIMTNFTNKLMADKQMMQDGAQGYERYDVIKANYDATPATSEGMQDLMKKVWFSLSYTKDINDPGFFHTDNANNATIKASEVYNNPDVLKNEAFVKEVEKGKADFANKSLWHKKDCSLWYTTHTTVYDLEKREFKVLVHEGLDGQKEWYHVTFNHQFNKPLDFQGKK